MSKNIINFLMEGKFNEAYSFIEDSISKEKKVDDLLLQHRIIKYWINHLEVIDKIENDYEKGLAYLDEWEEFLKYVEKHKMQKVDEINAIHYFIHKQAVEHLEKYCLVGLTEHFAQSLTMFENILELEHAEVPKSNVTHQRLRRTEIEPDVLEEIHRRNQYDLALYSKAEKLFTETLENPTSILSTKKMSSSSRDKNAENCDFILI